MLLIELDWVGVVDVTMLTCFVGIVGGYYTPVRYCHLNQI